MPALTPDLLARALATTAVHAAQQGGVFTVGQAVDAGLTPAHVRTLVARGTWVSVQHGVLADAERWAEAEHLTLCAGRLLRLDNEAVVSHESAWTLYELPYVDVPDRPTLTLPFGGVRAGGGLRDAVLPADQVVRFGVVPITSGPRTVVDVLRNAKDRGVAQALADGALRHEVSREQVEEMLTWCEGWPGVAQAREAWHSGNGKAESPLESRHRLLFREAGLPEPELQVTIRDAARRTVGRVDFLFRQQRTVVESDGRVKYEESDESKGFARRRSRTLWDEKLREDRLRDLGFEVVRATWADWESGGEDLVRRVLRAFDRAARRAA